jgi:hypothetical protein
VDVGRSIGVFRITRQAADEIAHPGQIGGVGFSQPFQPLSPNALGLRRQEIDRRQARLGGEPDGPVADDQDVGERLHHGAGEGDRVPVARQRADGAGGQRGAIHQTGVEFDVTEEVR